MLDTVGIVLAAGSSRRMGANPPRKPSVSGDPVNKMAIKIGGKTVLERSLEAFQKAGCFSRIIIACRKEDMEEAERAAKKALDLPYSIVEGGSERQYSVWNALEAAKGADVVAIHDGARCFVDPEVIVRCVEKAYETGSAAAGVKTKDTIKTIDGDCITGTVDRENLINIQTPQAFGYELITAAHKKAKEDGYLGTDECSLLERMGILISFVEAGYDNIKVTTQEDILYGRMLAGEKIRTGIGYDTHRLETGLPLMLGGVNIPHNKGLLGHSDADVLLHAIIDAMLGAAAAGDIGRHFPMTDEFKGISSMELLNRTKKIIEDKGYRIINIDSTVVMQTPRLAPYIDKMREKIAAALSIDIEDVSVKAKTTEGMGFEGREEGVSATAAATLVL